MKKLYFFSIFCVLLSLFSCKQSVEEDTSRWPRIYDSSLVSGNWMGTCTDLAYDTGEKYSYTLGLSINTDMQHVTLTVNASPEGDWSISEFNELLQTGGYILRLSPNKEKMSFSYIGGSGSMDCILQKKY